MRTLIAAYALIAGFIVVERRLRRGEAARTLNGQASDRGTTRVVGAAFGFALTAGLTAPVLTRLGVGRIASERVALSGLSLMLAGLSLRVWAAQTLGRFYTRTLRVAEDQTVVREGLTAGYVTRATPPLSCCGSASVWRARTPSSL